jgi:GGDEF domain-containing protein
VQWHLRYRDVESPVDYADVRRRRPDVWARPSRGPTSGPELQRQRAGFARPIRATCPHLECRELRMSGQIFAGQPPLVLALLVLATACFAMYLVWGPARRGGDAPLRRGLWLLPGVLSAAAGIWLAVSIGIHVYSLPAGLAVSIPLALVAAGIALWLLPGWLLRAWKTQQQQVTAMYDPVTGLPNRARFQQEVVRFIGSARASGRPFDLYRCAVRWPPHMTDAMTDEASRMVAERLRNMCGSGDFLARLRRDEFVLLRERCTDADRPATVWEQMVTATEGDITLEQDTVRPWFAIGHGEFPHDGEDSLRLLTAAGRKALVPEKGAERSVPLATAVNA